MKGKQKRAINHGESGFSAVVYHANRETVCNCFEAVAGETRWRPLFAPVIAVATKGQA